MIVTVTGTPGTGKTTVSEHLKDFYSVIDLTEFVRERGLGEEREEFEVNIEEMVDALKAEIDRDGDYLVEGHLAHHLPSGYCIVFRCNPEKLEERLSERDYSAKKVQDNAESEALDLILQEALEKQENIIEIDTTGMEPGEVASEIRERIQGDETGYGEVDWSSYL